MTTTIHLERDKFIPDQPTSGVLTAGSLVLATLEPPWRNGEKYKSCIPAGEYSIIPRRVGKYCEIYKKRWGHEYSLEVTDVGDRAVILIHTGNYANTITGKTDSKGCILLGMLNVSNHAFVGKSREAYQLLYDKLADEIALSGCVKLVIENNIQDCAGEAEDIGDRDQVEL